MVLINIETLTDSELKSIACQEDIEDWESLSREELIDELESIYEDNDDSDFSGTLRQKYVSSLIPGKSDYSQLPGVEEIPRHYNKTYIHLTQKDAVWAYVFWNLSESLYKEVEASDSKLVLRIIAAPSGKLSRKSYDIEITIHDKCWTIELPWPGRTYFIKLLLVDSNGNETSLCSSNTVERTKSWLSEHKDAIMDPDLYEILVKPLISKEGTPVNCSEVNNIVYSFEKKDAEI